MGATRGTISLSQEDQFKGAEYSEFRNPSVKLKMRKKRDWG